MSISKVHLLFHAFCLIPRMSPIFSEKGMAKGSVIISVAFHGVTVHTESIDLCDKVQCPITPGDFVLINTQVLPGITPPVGMRNALAEFYMISLLYLQLFLFLSVMLSF